MRNVVLAAVLLSTPLAAQETGAVRGRVGGAETGEPIPAVTVTVVGSSQSAQTDAEGQFRLTAVPAGSREILARLPGWKPLRRLVEILPGAETEIELRLVPAAAILEDLVVTVSGEAERRASTAVSLGVVDGEAIRTERPHHPGDVVRQVAGAWIANAGGEGHFTAIRQPVTTKPVYAFLEDGIPIRSVGFFNHNGLYEINLAQAGRVEIIKGPGSALHGSDAIGGVVNSLTRSPSERPEAELFLEGGRFGYGRTLLTGSTTSRGNGLRADLNLTRTDGYRDGAPFDRQSATLRWDRALGSGRLKSVVTFSHIDQPSDGGSDLSRADFESNIARNYNPVAYRRVRALRASTAYERTVGLSRLDVTLYGRANRLELLPQWQLSFDPQIWDSRNVSAGAMLRGRRTVPDLGASLSAGVDLEVSPGSRLEQEIIPVQTGSDFTGMTLGDVQYDYDVTFWQAAPYLQADLTPIDALHLSLGLRYDAVGYNYTTKLPELQTGTHRRPGPTSVSYQRLSPKVGISYELGSFGSLHASYRAAFRAPSESQVFRQGSAENTIDLAPVTADNYEAGARAALGNHATFDLTVYRLDMRNDIITLFDPASGLRFATNAGRTRHEGIEIAASIEPWHRLRLDAAMAYTDQQYLEWKPRTGLDFGGNDIEAAPRSLGRVGLFWIPPGFASGGASLEWVHLGRYWQNPENTNRYPGYDLLNLSATVPISGSVDLSGRVTNLTNRRFAEASTFNTFQGERLRPGQPRAFFLGLTWRLGGGR
jgi:outer membrane receptor protein involved in Fe transport